MSTFLSLVKVNLNVSYGFSALKYRFTKDKRKLWEPILIGMSAVIGIGSIVIMLTLFMLGLFIGASSPQINRPELVITIAFVAAQLMVFVFGIFYIMSSFYFSNDLNILIPMPLKPAHILGSKLLIVMINEYLTAIPILLPAIVIYGVGTKQNIFYWLKGITLILASPAIPLVLGAILVVILMRFVNLRKSKDLFAIIGGLLAILFAIGVNMFSQTMASTSGKGFPTDFIIGRMSAVEQIGRNFPPSIWATYGLTSPGLAGIGYFLLFLIFSIFLYILLMWIGNIFFYKSILAGQEVTRKRKAISEQEMEKRYKKVSNPVISIFWREWNIFLRTPVYSLNGLMGMIIAPFLLLMPFILRRDQMGELYRLVYSPSNIVPLTLVSVGITFFTSNINIIACTAISREGRTFWISKMIPVSPKEQILAKFLHALITGLIGVIITIGVLGVVFGLHAWSVAVIVILTVLGNIFITALNLIIDILRPKLEWTNPQEAVKQNFNGFLGILITFIAAGILAGITVVMYMAGCRGWLIFLILGIANIVLSIPSLWGMFKLADYRYRNIEV